MWENILNKEGVEIVTVVTMKRCWEHAFYSSMLDYGSKKVKKMEPCAVVDGKYFRIKDGEEVALNPENMGIWPVSMGTVFSWPDGEHVLLSRKIANHRQFLMPKEEFTFNPKTMVRYNVA